MSSGATTWTLREKKRREKMDILTTLGLRRASMSLLANKTDGRDKHGHDVMPDML
jgi:hypothetical protein